MALDSTGDLLGFVQLLKSPNSWTLEFVIDPDLRNPHNQVGQQLLSVALEFSKKITASKGSIYLWIPKPQPYHDLVAQQLGLIRNRELAHMRKDLSNMEIYVKDPHIESFQIAKDEQALIDSNNRAFKHHPEQGNWDLAILQQKQQQPWFDPKGLLLYKKEKQLGGFCWMKIDNFLFQTYSIGEIYILGVDPGFQGKGVGKTLIKAGLNWLKEHGVSIATLYVDIENKRAIALYESLGFTHHHTDRAYEGDLSYL